LQTIVALSTTEAEYIAVVEAGKEIAWMRNILSGALHPQNGQSKCNHCIQAEALLAQDFKTSATHYI